MSEYQLDIVGNIDLSDYSKIDDYIKIVGMKDNLVITLKEKSNELNIICDILKRNNFNIQVSQNKPHDTYYIYANKINGFF